MVDTNARAATNCTARRATGEQGRLAFDDARRNSADRNRLRYHKGRHDLRSDGEGTRVRHKSLMRHKEHTRTRDPKTESGQLGANSGQHTRTQYMRVTVCVIRKHFPLYACMPRERSTSNACMHTFRSTPPHVRDRYDSDVSASKYTPEAKRARPP